MLFDTIRYLKIGILLNVKNILAGEFLLQAWSKEIHVAERERELNKGSLEKWYIAN